MTATNGDYNIEEESTEHTAADSTKDTIPKVGTGELDIGAQAETAGQEPLRRSTRQRREPDRLTLCNVKKIMLSQSGNPVLNT